MKKSIANHKLKYIKKSFGIKESLKETNLSTFQLDASKSSEMHNVLIYCIDSQGDLDIEDEWLLKLIYLADTCI